MSELKCLPLNQTTDGPLMLAPNGTLSALQNMRLRPGGYAEARGGLDKIKPSGGTNADAISAGAYSAIHQVSTSYGWIRVYNSAGGAGTQYSPNMQFSAGGWGPFAAVGDALYWGADLPFSRVGACLSTAGAWISITVVYEYWNGAAWTALTTAETIDWTVVFTMQFASWKMPTDWAANTVGDAYAGNVLKYWMRARVSALNTLTVIPKVAVAFGYWTGMRELYMATQNPRSTATAGALYRRGQSGTTAENFAVASSLFSGNASPTRLASYRGRLIMVNGKETKRWDGNVFDNLGGTVFANTITLTVQVSPGIGVGIWRYYAAWGYGPCQNTDAYAERQDAQALYGPGRAVYLGEVTTTAGNEYVRFEMTAGPPSGVSAVYFYRTRDLTGVAAAARPSHPAFLVQSLRKKDETANTFELSFGAAGNYYYDTFPNYVDPQVEAYTFDISPPQRCKYLGVFQNRLLLGDDETWYISDPFLPDRFTLKSTTGYIRLARAQGGRHMGGIEFGDQFVMQTETQTWGVTNIDLDIYQLFPIHLGIGSVAPDATAMGDGLMIQMARDGFYAWDGDPNKLPWKISSKWDMTFGKLSFENHGGSRATICNRRYEVRLAPPDYSTQGTAYCYDMESGQWSTVVHAGLTSSLFPMATIHAPLGNSDAGAVHPVWAKADYGTGAGDYSLFLGELTTQDNATNYTCSATMFFPQLPNETFTPSRVLAYYQAADGWATPTLAYAQSTDIGGSVGSITTKTPDTGDDYSVIAGDFSQTGAGTSDMKVTFSAVSAAGGTLRSQRLFGAVLDGSPGDVRMGP